MMSSLCTYFLVVFGSCHTVWLRWSSGGQRETAERPCLFKVVGRAYLFENCHTSAKPVTPPTYGKPNIEYFTRIARSFAGHWHVTYPTSIKRLHILRAISAPSSMASSACRGSIQSPIAYTSGITFLSSSTSPFSDLYPVASTTVSALKKSR